MLRRMAGGRAGVRSDTAAAAQFRWRHGFHPESRLASVIGPANVVAHWRRRQPRGTRAPEFIGAGDARGIYRRAPAEPTAIGSGFRHLKQLAVNMIKIDGAFVRNIGENPDNLAFVRTLIDLARTFNLQTVAECVETMEEAETMRNEGVDFLQGYAFGAPQLNAPWHDSGVADKKSPVAEPKLVGSSRG